MFGWLKRKVGKWAESERIFELETKLASSEAAISYMYEEVNKLGDQLVAVVEGNGAMAREWQNARRKIVEFLGAALMASGGELTVTQDTLDLLKGTPQVIVDFFPDAKVGDLTMKLRLEDSPADQVQVPDLAAVQAATADDGSK